MSDDDTATPMPAADVLGQWHAAVNVGDIEAAVALCADDVEVRGPRGTGQGHELMRGWLARSGIRLTPQEDLLEVEGRFVVRELAHWTTADAPAAAPTDPTQTWCVFTVSGGLLTSVARYEAADQIPGSGG